MTEDWRKVRDIVCCIDYSDDEKVSEICLLLTTRTEQAVAEERKQAEDRLRAALEQEFYGESDALISGQGWEQKVTAVLQALQDPRRGGELNK